MLRLARAGPSLAPAGNEAMMRAAVENGADAIYFGVEEFNARLRADNFRAADLPRVMEWLHERGVRGYVTLNTLVFCGELDAAAALLAACSDAGVDAVLVQDLGVAALAARLVPDLPIHASTQTTLTSAEGIAMAQELGMRIERVVAARELSVKELRLLRRNAPCEVEAFIHGALCVAYSGQCLTSEALGGPQRQPRRVCAGVPAAVRSDGGRGLARHRRREVCAVAEGPRRVRRHSEAHRVGHCGVQDRGAAEIAHVCRCDRAGLPPGGGRGVGAAAPGARRRTLRWMSRRASRWR